MHLYVWIDAWDILTKKRKQHPPSGDDASTAEAAPPGRVGRGEQGEARRANSTPNGGPHIELLLGACGFKPGINLTYRLPRRQGQHTCTYTCVLSVSIRFLLLLYIYYISISNTTPHRRCNRKIEEAFYKTGIQHIWLRGVPRSRKLPNIVLVLPY